MPPTTVQKGIEMLFGEKTNKSTNFVFNKSVLKRNLRVPVMRNNQRAEEANLRESSEKLKKLLSPLFPSGSKVLHSKH